MARILAVSKRTSLGVGKKRTTTRTSAKGRKRTYKGTQVGPRFLQEASVHNHYTFTKAQYGHGAAIGLAGAAGIGYGAYKYNQHRHRTKIDSVNPRKR